MALSFMETIARSLFLKFYRQCISTGCITVKEEDGTVVTFGGSKEKCPLEVVLKVHNSGQFYWKLITEYDLGFADAYINGDCSFEDKEDGISNFIMLIIVNKESNTSISIAHESRGWWASGKFLLKHVLRQNTVKQARRNISHHYDVSNEFFQLFLDETMQYSCALFKTEDEDLKIAQQRKMSSLIEKARIRKGHEVLDIGCGWGSLAIETVKRTGCKYTGITLSEEQLKYAQALVKKEGLQGFFRCCESLLAENGLFVLQFISITEELFPTFLHTPEFFKEYIFRGGCLVSLTRMLAAMAAGSRLSVEHVENLGPNSFARTLKCWRNNLLANKSKVLALGFDEKFIRTWEYYFCYGVGAFKSGMLKYYQVVFSRQGNVAALGDPYQGFPSAFSF
ncbi:Mycolic acid cyclopropane synthase [Corchorus olitorius]|uniref:Mycolic acid cyclopropane synthase n=1 Tax=Corchorus olitorius TaxID=93759 RepID=A0A1R3HZK3_9ROSI|nr:Mycolic acid cyclopropane synthase [Corchorus olitorius]